MHQLRVDRRPLYIQAYEFLSRQIEQGVYRPGERLPSEAALAAQLGISRPTLREALHKLERDGVIVRRHGVGTFVSPHNLVFESGLEVLESLQRQARQMGMETEVAHLAVVERPASEEEREMLRLADNGAVDVFSVDRVIAVAGEPVAYLQDVVPRGYLRREELEEHFSGSVLDLFLQQGVVQPVASHTQIGAEEADAPLASRLGVGQGTALLKLVGQLYGSDGEVLDYSVGYFIPGHFKFHVTRRVDRN